MLNRRIGGDMQGAENAQVHVFPFFAIIYKTKLNTSIKLVTLSIFCIEEEKAIIEQIIPNKPNVNNPLKYVYRFSAFFCFSALKDRVEE